MTKRRSAQVGSSVVVAIMLLSSCGGGTGTEAVEALPAAATVSPGPTGTDSYDPKAVKFLEHFNPGTDLGYAPTEPASIREAMRWSTVVLLAEISDVTVGATSGPTEKFEGRSFSQTAINIRLKPIEILHGRLQKSLADVNVAMCCAYPTKEDPTGIGELKASLPSGQSVWFLRWTAARPDPTEPKAPAPLPQEFLTYSIVDLGSVFVQGFDQVVAPMYSPLPERAGKSSAGKEGAQYRKLSEVVGKARTESALAAIPTVPATPLGLEGTPVTP